MYYSNNILKKLSTIFCCLGFCCIANAQDFSNEGKDFWVGYGSHVEMYNENGTVNNVTGGTQNMVLYFTSETDAHVQVEIPATGWKRNYFVPANSVAESDSIPKFGNDDARLGMEGVSKKGIHITSDAPIIAYCHIYNASVSGAALLFPVNILGQDYYTLNFTQTSIDNYSYSFCFYLSYFS